MDFILHPWQFLLAILAGWINHEQQKLIDYLRTKNQVLKEKLGKNRIVLNDDQRRRLAVQGKILGRKLLGEIGCLFTPDTILRWHRLLVAEKWDQDEALARIIFFSEAALRNAVIEFLVHYHHERNHQGLDHKIPQPGPEVGQSSGEIVCRERLGGILKYYQRKAA